MRIFMYLMYICGIIAGLIFLTTAILIKYNPSKKLLGDNLINREKYIKNMLKTFLITGTLYLFVTILSITLKYDNSAFTTIIYNITFIYFIISWALSEKKYGVIRNK